MPTFLRQGESLAAYLRVVVPLFLLAFYLPIPAKATNDVFYLGIALPVFLWILAGLPALTRLVGQLAWFFLSMAGMALLMALRDISLLKPVLYLLLWFSCCLLLRQHPADPGRGFQGFALVSVLLLAVAVADWLWQRQVGGAWVRQTLWGQSGNPVHAALLMVSALVHLWVFQVEARLAQRSRGLLLAGFCVLLGLVLLCASVFQARSALLGFGLFLAAYLWQRRLLWPGLLCLAAALFLLYLLGLSDLLLQAGLSSRLAIWQDALQHLGGQCRLWVGCAGSDYRFLGAYEHPHSAYLSLLYYYGAPAAVVFCCFALAFFWRAGRARSRWLLVALVGWGGVLTSSSGVFTAPQPLWVYFWLPSFMAILDAHPDALAGYFAARQSAQSAPP
ncbi:MAG: hypothetical protein JNK99_11130 [Candidatus Accumulibacter sp.]|uniref:hypothetical protein n=1 Tax=Accumulibacter sp. TaxID=2053492 RepID=UPI001A45AC2A|nr:hypothetical protein [Accumulibacter sp.]MBL8395280.1 hypothetical protein [Accumulibacter sp.]